MTAKDVKKQIHDFLQSYNRLDTYEHCLTVGEYAGELAEKFSIDAEKARIAGYLHDISAIYPNNLRIQIAHQMKIELNEQELEFPMIIHQKISKKMAEDVFDIYDQDILSAIECHTTLKGNFSKLDLVLFDADKIKWDQAGHPPYYSDMKSKLSLSLEEAVLFYIEYILKNGIKVVHPWLKAAQKDLKKFLQKNKIFF